MTTCARAILVAYEHDSPAPRIAQPVLASANRRAPRVPLVPLVPPACPFEGHGMVHNGHGR